MQHEEAKAIRESWGDKHCDHPAFEDKYLFTSKTGDFFCVQCGRSFTQREKAAHSQRASSPSVGKFIEQSTLLKERLDKAAKYKDRLAALETANPNHDALAELLKQQESLIFLIDQLVWELEQGI